MCSELLCDIVYDEQNLTLALIVVDHPERPTLLGRNWLAKLRLNWSKMFHVKYEKAGSPNAKQRLNWMLKNKAHLFEDSYDGLKGHEAHIRVKLEAKPVFHKHHRVPYELREPVEAKLRKLEENGVVKKVERSEWASPIVLVPKADRSVRIYGGYKVSINPSVEDEQITNYSGSVCANNRLQNIYQVRFIPCLCTIKR